MNSTNALIEAKNDTDALITALEAAQAELADAVEMLAEEGFSVTDEKGLEYVTLRKQLAEAHKFSDKLGVSCDRLLQKNNDLRVELDRAQAENNSVLLCNEISNAYIHRLESQLAEAHLDINNLPILLEEKDKQCAFYREVVREYEQETFPKLKKELAECRTENKAIEEHIAEHGVPPMVV